MTSPAPMREDEVRELQELCDKATAGPWTTRLSVFGETFDAHWWIETVDKLPEHPWSTRTVAWMTGSMRSDLSVNNIKGAKYCKECNRWHLGHREIGCEVRIDKRMETDAQLIARSRTAIPQLLAERQALLSRLTRMEAALKRIADGGFIDPCEIASTALKENADNE